MNYDFFIELVKGYFMDYMSKEFQDYKMEINPVHKTNQTLDALNLFPANGEERKWSPTVYVNDIYDTYQYCGDWKEAVRLAAYDMERALKSIPENIYPTDHDKVKDNIVMTLVNTEQNREMLANIPHREFQDLSIIYRWVTETRCEGMLSAIVNKSFSEQLGMDEVALYNAAISNTKRLFPPVIKTMNEVVRDVCIKEGMPAEFADVMIEEMPAEKTMYIIGNESGINGAASMLYETILHKLAENLETDLYILPSSVHEVIAVSVDLGDPNELAKMVAEINMGQVSLEERLSNQVYHYDKDLRKLTLATDTPNKRIDGIVEEPGINYETKQSR